MMTFAHGEFRVFLEAYAKVRGVTVVHPSEAFTTKTCTGCGFVEKSEAFTPFTVSDAD
jgi:transposase